MRAARYMASAALLLSVLPTYAAALVNINTANQATLETLNGIGPSKAVAIITYRNDHGPFQKIEDIMNVSGIGTATFNNIKDSITVGDTAPQQAAAPQSTPTTTPAQSAQFSSANGASGSNGPPPISVYIDAPTPVMVGGGSYFEAAAYGKEGLPLTATRYLWNFGDGTTAEGARVLHSYAYPGRYVVGVTAAHEYSSSVDRMTVEALPARVELVAEGDGSLTIYNRASSDLGVGSWSLVDSGVYVLPEDTLILHGEGVRLSPKVTGLRGSADARLLYPNGSVAASARVGADSPLRGERVVSAPAAIVHAPELAAPAVASAAPLGEVRGTSSERVESGDNTALLYGSLAALVGVLVVGAAAAYLLQRPVGALETPLSADEFELEEES